MATLANKTINDGQATPVAHTFTPRADYINSIFYWEDRASGIPIGFPTFSYSLRQPVARNTVKTANGAQTLSSGVYKELLKFTLPTLESLAPSSNGYTPAPTVAYTHEAHLELKLPERGTQAQRNDFIEYVINMLVNMKTELKTLDSYWQ